MLLGPTQGRRLTGSAPPGRSWVSSLDTIQCQPKGKVLLGQPCPSSAPPSGPNSPALPRTAEPCRSSVRLSSTAGCTAPTPACAVMIPNYQGRERNISFPTEEPAVPPAPSPAPSSPLGIVLAPSPAEGEGGEGTALPHRKHHLPLETHESSPQGTAGVSPRRRIPVLCPHVAEENQPK